jgi:hypothetical protein
VVPIASASSNPHLQMPGAWIEIMEIMPLPEM